MLGKSCISAQTLSAGAHIGTWEQPPKFEPDMADSFENTVTTMDYVVGFEDLIRQLAKPPVKVQ